MSGEGESDVGSSWVEGRVSFLFFEEDVLKASCSGSSGSVEQWSERNGGGSSDRNGDGNRNRNRDRNRPGAGKASHQPSTFAFSLFFSLGVGTRGKREEAWR